MKLHIYLKKQKEKEELRDNKYAWENKKRKRVKIT